MALNFNQITIAGRLTAGRKTLLFQAGGNYNQITQGIGHVVRLANIDRVTAKGRPVDAEGKPVKTLVDKGYANKDYTHISHAGGRRLATHLVESILAGFDIYKQQQP